MTTITSQMFYQNFLTGLQQNLQAELTDSTQISLTKRISRPSDDPSTLWKVVDYQTQISQIAQYQQTIGAATVPLQSLDSSLTTLSNTLAQANELAVSGADASKDASSRAMIASEVQQQFDDAVSVANTQVDGRYIFGGYQQKKSPIDQNGEFVSDNYAFNVNIADGVSITTNVSAGSLFSFKRVNSTDSPDSILPLWNSSNNGTITVPNADPVSALYMSRPSGGDITDANAANFTSGGTLTIFSGTGDSSPAVITVAAGSSLEQVRDAINAQAGTKVNAQIVNNSTDPGATAASTPVSSRPDYRLVISSNPAGSSDKVDIAVTGTTDAFGSGLELLGFNNGKGAMTLQNNIANYNYFDDPGTANSSLVVDDGTNGGVANNQIVFQELVGGVPKTETATITRGTYTAGQLATAIGQAMTAMSPKANTYTASYNTNTGKFTINAGANSDATLEWGNSGTTAAQLLGFNPATDSADAVVTGGSTVSDNTVLDNYYSFNNNYLNDKYVLRALNFENQSLKNNDPGRISQSLQYLNDLTNTVSNTQASVGARENELTYEKTYQTDSSTNIQTFLSQADDTDLAKVASDLTQRQTALQALRTISGQVLNQTLFDFVKF